MKIEKILTTVLLVLGSGTALASGPLDGIYSCLLSSVAGNASVYIAINSNASTTIISIPNLPGTSFDGYIAGGAASDTAFSGTSSYGYYFTATAKGAVGAKQLAASGAMNLIGYGVVSGTATCYQIL